MKTVQALLSYAEANFHNIFWGVVLMVSGIIVLIGLLKPLLYNKIKNKQVRKFALAFSNVALSFICALVVFVLKDWDLNYYLASAIALSISCIVTYWLYENTCLRNLIATIGNMVLKSIANKVLLNTADVAELTAEAKKAVGEFKKTTKEDKDLKEL